MSWGCRALAIGDKQVNSSGGETAVLLRHFALITEVNREEVH
jgi:hypothetical protein